MNIDKDIIVCGDVHGDFRNFNNLINKKKPKIVLQCGDFGYWVRFPNHKVPKPGDAKVYWCDGNHEDFQELHILDQHQWGCWVPNVWHKKRGSTLTLPDGRVVMFAGGAWSIDWQWRTDGIDWFKYDELLTESDIAWVDPNQQVDIIISHTAPLEFDLDIPGERENDFSRKTLSYLLDIFKPSLYYFGHWHKYKHGIHYYDSGGQCVWTALDHDRGGGVWWKHLEVL